MTSAELRSLFLRYFEDLGHTLVASSPLVPANDPTLLFTNAGMVQFKDVFLGREERSYLRAASAQRCVRAGGKHNDLENVGYTGRHHTFFEMLGNFSFGDYFKREAIQYAWVFLTETLKLPPERLWVTVYDQDQEAADIWLKEVGIDPARFTRIGTKDNFWSMGDTGPCGPCSEIFYDHGPGIPGGPPGSPDEEGDRYVEIWNLVFMQYDRAADGTLTPLPKPSVDTGMGLERIAAVTQGVHSNYDIDLFRNLLRAAAELVGLGHTDHASLRVIADHIRSCAFLITDGVVPSNEGRGYVLRRILRRAIRHGYKLGLREPFFHKLVGPLCGEMGGAYPELVKARDHVEKVLHREEERFFETIENGMLLLEKHLGIPIVTGTLGAEPTRLREIPEGRERLPAETAGKPIFPGDIAFMLYDTYGFPLDLTADVCREHGVIVDEAGFQAAMARQREQSRAASQFSAGYEHGPEIEGGCEFTGYEHLQEQTRILGLWRDGHPIETLHAGEEATVALERTPFYGESGGQVGDTGKIIAGEAVFEVIDTQKQSAGLHLHKGRLLLGVLHVGDPCQAVVDAAKRQATALNHSATHLLHAALRRVLGPHVTQKGSLVNADRLRFDFAHDTPMSADEIARVEKLVNEQIRHNAEVRADIMARDEAMALGAMALFGEKYGEEVRVLRIGDFSTELCGGTHVDRAGDIGFFKILGESGVAAGIRRIEAVTGQRAVERAEESERLIQLLSERLKVSRDGLHEKTQQLLERNRQLEKELERLKAKVASAAGSDLATHAIEIGGIRLLVARVDEADPKTLRDLADQLKNKLGHGAIVLAAVREGKVNLIAGVTQELSTRLKASDLVNCVAVQVGGKGGGRPDLAQAGGNEPAHLDAALRTVPDWVRQRLA